jgi:hypothetical protein
LGHVGTCWDMLGHVGTICMKTLAANSVCDGDGVQTI